MNNLSTIDKPEITNRNHNNNGDITSGLEKNETKTHNTTASPVVNLSGFQLTQPQVSVLSKGLNFCPTPGEPDFGEIRRDLDKLHRDMRRTQFFNDQKFVQDQNPTIPVIPNGNPDPKNDHLNSNVPFKHYKFKKPSTWEPPGPPALEAFAMLNEADLSLYQGSSPKFNNLTREERTSIEELRNNSEIIIKPADKGSSIVVMNTTDYIKEAKRQLSTPNST